MTYILIAFLVCSVFLNGFLFTRLRVKPKRAQSVELQEFLADLLSGGPGIVAVGRVDPSNLLLRSPKQR